MYTQKLTLNVKSDFVRAIHSKNYFYCFIFIRPSAVCITMLFQNMVLKTILQARTVREY